MSALDRADTKSVGILTSTVLILVIVLGGSVLVRVVVGWFEAFRGASAKSCASAMLAEEKAPNEATEIAMIFRTGEHLMNQSPAIKSKPSSFLPLLLCAGVPKAPELIGHSHWCDARQRVANLAQVAQRENFVGREKV